MLVIIVITECIHIINECKTNVKNVNKMRRLGCKMDNVELCFLSKEKVKQRYFLIIFKWAKV